MKLKKIYETVVAKGIDNTGQQAALHELLVDQVEQTKQKMRDSLDEMDNHFNALMQRYFE